MISRRTFGLSAASLITAGIPSAIAGEKPSAAAKKPRVLVTISKETTYITEPLRPDGYPDYIATLNQRCSKGVTPENNAAVLLWQALGPGKIDAEAREKFFALLGIAPLPEKGDYFVDINDYVAQKAGDNDPKGDVSSSQPNSKILERLRTAEEKPWSKRDDPLIDRWLTDNETPLAIFATAVTRPRYYQPIVSDADGLLLTSVATVGPRLMPVRDVAHAICARAMLKMGDGNIRGAWADLCIGHQLGRLIGQGPTVMDVLIGFAVEQIAYAGDLALLERARLSSKKIRGMRDELDRLARIAQMADKIEISERFVYLDGMTALARNGLSWVSKLSGRMSSHTPMDSLVDGMVSEGVDWDIVCRHGNSFYDRLVAVFRRPKGIEQGKALGELTRELRKSTEPAQEAMSFAFSFLANPRKSVSQQLAQKFLRVFGSVVSACEIAERRAVMQMELVRTAFALAQYRADRGKYPSTLAELKPAHADSIPIDIFGGGEIRYRKVGQGYILNSIGPFGEDKASKTEEPRTRHDDLSELVVRMTD